MKNKMQKFIEEEVAKNEKAISARELLEEIAPLFGDYFVGDISFYGERITYLMPNGQKFILTAVKA